MPENRPPALPDSAARDPRRVERARLVHLKKGLPRQKIARRSGHSAPKNPFFARAGGSSVGGPLPAGRATRGLTFLVVGALSLGCGRWFFIQKFDLGGEAERIIRAQFLPQLERQLGAKIEVGAIDTDWLGRVTLRDVVIGRNAALPTGALAQVKSIAIGLDVPGLVLKRATFPAAIRWVALQGPQIYLRRDKSGLNWSKLLPKSSSGAKTAWTGRISATQGRVYYLDTALPSASGQPLIMDARGIDATLDALAGAPYRFAARSSQPFFGSQKRRWNAISSDGLLENDLKSGLLNLESRAVPLAPLGDFAFPHRDVSVRGGAASGRVQLALRGGALTPRGHLTLSGAALTLSQVREPNTARGLALDAIDGPVAFAGRAFSTTGAHFRALDGDFRVAGAASLEKEALFDVQLDTAALPIARLRGMLPLANRPEISSGAAVLSAHIAGTARDLSATGTLQAPQARFLDAKSGVRAAFPLFRAAFAASLDSRAPSKSLDWRLATRFSGSQGTISAPQGQIKANFDGTVRGGAGGGWEMESRARDFALQAPHYGLSRGQSLQISASTASLAQPRWNGTVQLERGSTSGLHLAAFSPQVARVVEKSGALSGTARFVGLNPAAPQKASVEAAFSLAGLDLNPGAFGSNSLRSALPLRANDFHLSALQGRLALSGGRLDVSRASATSAFGPLRLDAQVPLRRPELTRIALSLPAVALDAARFAPWLRAQNLALDGDWRGRLSILSSASPDGRLGLDFDLRSAAARGRGLGRGGALLDMAAPRLRGRADFDARNPARTWNGSVTLQADAASLKSGSLGRFATLPASLMGARARGLKLNLLARTTEQQPAWTGDVSAQSVSAPVATSSNHGAFLTLSDAHAHLAPVAGGIDIARFEANLGRGNVAGTARLAGRNSSAQVLARSIDVGELQRLLAPATLASARLSGEGNAAFRLAPGAAPSADLRLTGGRLDFPRGSRIAPLPLDGGRAQLSFLNGAIQVSDALLWSRGTRLSGTANLGAQWSGRVQLAGARLEQLAAFPAARALQSAHPDGLLSGDFNFRLDPRDPLNATVSGLAQLRLANVMGASIDRASAQIRLQNSAAGWQIAASDVAGEVEDAPFSGALSADLRANAWHLRLATQNLGSERLARLGALSSVAGTVSGLKNRAQALERALPVSGAVTADIDLSGTLRAAKGAVAPGALAPRARDGFVHLASGPLNWRGRAFGALRADVDVENGVARAKTLELRRPDTGGADDAPPLLSISGQLPLDPDSPALQAQIRVAEAPLAFFTQALEQGRDALLSSGVQVPLVERALSYAHDLPNGTTGRVALDANLEGAWRAPRVHVTRLTLREGRARVAGGFSPPATLDAAFSYEKGAVTVERAEFRLKKAALAAPNAADEEDDTLLRIEPGASAVPDGAVTLSADVFNANLSQLSTWVPALRDESGGPLLRGDLTEFSFRVGGETTNPVVTGSIQAENLAFNAYTLDRLRVSRFDIGGAAARIEPGNLTIVKGAFQSSSAYGTLPWSWSPVGPVRGGALDVHFPLQTRDFGALTGVFVPALAVANADEFQGSVDVSGTLEAPQISGAVSIRGGQLRLDSRQNSLQAGLTNLSGTVRFVGGNQLLIDADDPLRGRFVAANAIVGRPTRRDDISAAPPARPAVAAGGPEPKGTNGAPQTAAQAAILAVNPRAATGSTSRSAVVAAAGRNRSAANDNAPKLAGDWTLRGGITRETRFDQNALTNPALALSRLRYDLNLALDKGLYAANGLPGVEDVSLGLIWKTGSGERPELAQNLRWMLAARGQKPRKLKTGGQLTSFGVLTLPPDFAAGLEALGRARPGDFSGETDFADLGVRKRIDFSKVADRRTQVAFQDFAASLTGAGSGVLDGRLVLDNRAPVQKAPSEAIGLQRAAVTGRGARPSLFGPSFEAQTGSLGLARTLAARSEVPIALAPQDAPEEAPDSEPLRLGGTLTLENAEIYGAPAGGEGGALLLSRLPDAPQFDVRLNLGRDVEIVTAAFRAGLGGEVVIGGSPRNPQILGTLQTRDGQVRFPNARARVEQGQVSIALNRDPDTDGLRTRVEIDATARGQAGAYTITLRMRGPLDLSSGNTQSLNIDVTSNPPLSQSEAFEQLLGTVPNLERQGDGTFKTGSVNRAYTNAIVNVLSAPLFAGVEQTLAQTLGLTSVGFEYRFNEPLAIQFTKALGDRVFVSYRRSLGSGPSSDLSNTSNGRTPFELRIEYRIKGDYLLGLQTDERQVPSLTLQRTRRF